MYELSKLLHRKVCRSKNILLNGTYREYPQNIILYIITVCTHQGMYKIHEKIFLYLALQRLNIKSTVMLQLKVTQQWLTKSTKNLACQRKHENVFLNFTLSQKTCANKIIISGRIEKIKY